MIQIKKMLQFLLKLVPKQLIKTLYEENSLKQCNCVKYYTGNNKLIIEYKDNNIIMLYY